MTALYVFIDVSGNYDFAGTGTRYLVMTGLTCTDICSGIIELHTCKHRLIDGGFEVEYFHAAEDQQAVRNKVFDIVSKFDHVRIDSVISEKSNIPTSLQSTGQIYPYMVEMLLNSLLTVGGIKTKKSDKVFIFMDRELSHSRDREPLIKGVKKYLSQHLSRTPYQILMHSSMSHTYLQVVDYCSWAIYRKWEMSDRRSYDKIQRLIKSERPIFEEKDGIVEKK
jgi:hypothetical protein